MELNPQAKLGQLLSVAKVAWRADHDLSVLLRRIESASTGPLYWSELSAMTCAADSDERGKLFPVAFHFSAFIIAQTMVMFWVAQGIVLAHLCKIYCDLVELVKASRRELAQGGVVLCSCGQTSPIDIRGDESPGLATVVACVQHFRMDMLLPLGHRAEPATPLRKVCQSVEYFLRKGMGGFARSLLLPTIALVRIYFSSFGPGWDREILWASEMLGVISTKGSKMALCV